MEIASIILTGLLSSGFFAFIQFLITRNDKKHDEVEELRKEFKESKETSKKAFDEIREMLMKMSKENEDIQTLLKAQGHVLLSLAKDKIVFLSECYVERGAITLKELSALKSIYTPYHDELGGNGEGQAGYEACCKLRIVSEEEAEALDNEAKKKKYGLTA